MPVPRRVGIGTVVLIILIRAHWNGSPPPVTRIGAAGGQSSATSSLPHLGRIDPSQSGDEEDSSGQTIAKSTAKSKLPKPLDRTDPSQSGDEEETLGQTVAKTVAKSSRLPKPAHSGEAGEDSAVDEPADAVEEEQEAVVKEVKAKGGAKKLPGKQGAKKGGATLSVGLAEPSEECHVEVTAQYKGLILSKRHEESASSCRQSCRCGSCLVLGLHS